MPEVTKKTTVAYYAQEIPDDKHPRKIIEENTDGTFSISDWHCLDEGRLKTLLSTLQVVLTDIAATRAGVPTLHDLAAAEGG